MLCAILPFTTHTGHTFEMTGPGQDASDIGGRGGEQNLPPEAPKFQGHIPKGRSSALGGLGSPGQGTPTSA